MCGIVGFAGVPGAPEQLEGLARAMCARIRHRGPDGDGFLRRDGLVLGMRRLSVIDTEGGWQPIANEDGSIHVVFNGEIYNHAALRRSLESAGHHFATRSDTEVIVHGYEQYGDEIVRHLHGMFAFALWDERRKRLLLARDHFGQKPLYLWSSEGQLAFASELKSLTLLPWIPQAIDTDAILRYLALGYVPDPFSAYQDVRKLAPGHRAIWTRADGLRTERYWDPASIPESTLSESDAVVRLRELLRNAVEAHLVSDVPIGAFLSGGLDSSAVVAQMCRVSRDRVRTFSIGFNETGFDESATASRTAATLGTEHVSAVVRAESALLLDQLVDAFDEPFADSSALPTYYVAKLAREHVTVALSGDGGDELFGGYARYLNAAAGQRHGLPRWLRGVFRALPHAFFGRNRLLDLTRTADGRYASTVAFPLALGEGGVVPDHLLQDHLALERIFAEACQSAGDRDPVSRQCLVDIDTYLPGDILTKVDRMTMLVSLEARVPLLDVPFAEFALSLPGRYKVQDGLGKHIFRAAIRGLVPDYLFDLPKSGFAVPLATWFRGSLRPLIEALGTAPLMIDAYTDRGAVQRLVREHLSERRDHSHALWRLLVLERWLDRQATGLSMGQSAPCRA
jgi:asparagine synthase (glutamine-hydrolysing)